ncbi:MAG: hypothetical protein ABIR26_13570 [Ramlibacter sp.]
MQMSKITGVVALACALALIGLAACKQPVQPNDRPVSFWADPNNGLDTDPCVHATAQAIVKSGLSYPNFGGEEVTKTVAPTIRTLMRCLRTFDSSRDGAQWMPSLSNKRSIRGEDD